MGWNLTLDIGLDCVCCQQSDRCTDDCICPACWWPERYDAVERDLAAVAWRAYAPLTKALNDEGVNWGCATEEGYKRKVTWSLELLIPDTGEWAEVHRQGQRYVASWWRMTSGSRVTDTPPEPVMIDELAADTPDEVVNFIQNCTHHSREAIR